MTTSTRFTVVTMVSPSPQDLLARCSAEEQVAADILLGPGCCGPDAEQRLCVLVPDEKRRNYLRALVGQLAGLGTKLQPTGPAFTADVAAWQELRLASQARAAEQQRLAENVVAAERAALAALSLPVARARLRKRRRDIRRAPSWQHSRLWAEYQALTRDL